MDFKKDAMNTCMYSAGKYIQHIIKKIKLKELHI